MEKSQRKVLKAPSTQAGDMQLLWETQLVGLLKHGNWEPSANLDHHGKTLRRGSACNHSGFMKGLIFLE